MPGLPPIDYDEGEECPACTLTNPITPKSFKLTTSGIRNSGGIVSKFNDTVILQQLFFALCEYEIQTGNPIIFWNYFYYGSGPGGAFSQVFIQEVSPGPDVFKGILTDQCSLGGTMQNEFTAANPSPDGYYGGTATIVVF